MTTQVHTFKPRNAALELFDCRDPEVLIEGPAGSGKSRAALEKIHAMALANPGMRGLIVRKTQVSLTNTAMATWRRDVIPETVAAGAVEYYGGSRDRPAGYLYTNGATIETGGMDKSTKIMSSEYDVIYCLSGDTPVDSPSPIEKGYRRPYSGPIITIETANGNKLTGTPNHPILTDHGWVGLGELYVGGYVVSRIAVDDVRFRGDPHVQNKPATIAEVVRSLDKSAGGGGRTKRVPTVPVDFHGDGGCSYVDVVSAASLFHDRGDTSGGEHVGELDGDRGDLEHPLLVCAGSPIDLTVRSNPTNVRMTNLSPELSHAFTVGVGVDPPPAGRFPTLTELPVPVGIGVADVAHRLNLGASARTDTTGSHLASQSVLTDPERFRDHHKTPLPSEVTLDRIVHFSIGEAPRGWHVYNLQTADSWYYADNIVSHNCQEATELTEDDWESLTTRLRSDVVSFQQLIGDCNPDRPTHWLNQRCDRGQTTRLRSRHEDNPTLYTDAGELTDSGARYMAKLDALTGTRYQRLRLGNWVGAEGVVYPEFETSRHVIDPHPVPEGVSRWWSLDFGFVHPFVCQHWYEDHDGALVMYREFYGTRRLVAEWAEQILNTVTDNDGVWTEPRPVAIIADHDAEGRETFSRIIGQSTTPAIKRVTDGIQAVQQRLRDGRLLFMRDALHEADPALRESSLPAATVEEIGGYIWADSKTKEQPVKDEDHGMDAARYMVAQRDIGSRPRLRFLPTAGGLESGW